MKAEEAANLEEGTVVLVRWPEQLGGQLTSGYTFEGFKQNNPQMVFLKTGVNKLILFPLEWIQLPNVPQDEQS